ncbi:sensor histidine kinase [Rhodococcus sp. NPDC047139]|uniref:sensor histidine kinase n=1 Tax=Rhodococcus sp. NPDC047139 TaxID=3155141 RepID=UPI0033C47459
MPHTDPRSLTDALQAGPRYLLGAWPVRAFSANAMAAVSGPAIALLLLPLLVAGAARGARAALWAPLLNVEASRLSLIDGEIAGRFRVEADLAAADGAMPVRRRIAYVLLVAVISPVTFAFTLFVLLIDVVLLASPWLVRDGTVTVLLWQVGTEGDAWIALTIGVITTVATAYLVGLVSLANIRLATWSIVGGSELRREVARLTESRASLLEAVEHERRRIESELHDRVQHRLVALALTLGMAESVHGDDPTGQLAGLAHGHLDEALAELRAVILGISPRALAEHGLAAAVTDLVGTYPLPVDVDLGDTETPDRLPPAIEDAAYRVVAEALTNIVKHSGATTATISARRAGASWQMTVIDDGVGNARVLPGRGLDSLKARIDAVDGTLTVISPDRGPTEIMMRCPIPTP